VISIDLDVTRAREAISAVDPSLPMLTLVEGDVLDESLPDRVEGLLPPNASCLLVDDSAHTYETTYAALTGFYRFVASDGFFVVEDGCVDVENMRVDPSWPRGVTPAIEDFLGSDAGGDFVVRRDLERYGITCHINGYLQRVARALT
jgi:cephalosporin hydroxylase